MTNLATNKLLDNLGIECTLPKTDGPTISVSQTVSAAAVVYEAARNAVEFRADHLIRRAAIERILKRRLITKPNGERIAENLVRELLWAKYLENNTVSTKIIPKVQQSVDKYLTLKKETVNKHPKGNYQDWIISMASCEIEKILAPAPNREALINYVYQSFKNQVAFEDNSLTQKDLDVQIYIAVHRAYALSDDPIIQYQLLLASDPGWIEISPQEVSGKTSKLIEKYEEIQKIMNYPFRDKLKNRIKSETAPFLIIRDLFEKNPSEFKSLIGDPVSLKNEAENMLNKRYLEIKNRLRRAAARSIVYIFLTKMVFALIIELPFDLYFKTINYLALTINTIFPPALMFAFTASLSFPGRKNTDKILEKINNYLYEEPNGHKIVIVKNRQASLMFNFFYFLTFILIFGLILNFLNTLHFSFVSKIIFVFFLCVVSFFAYRVRLDANDYVLDSNDSTLGPIADFIFLPILKVGQWFSGRLQQINVLLFFLDFIIEAPFKAFFYVTEEWIHFMKNKKEEIIS